MKHKGDWCNEWGNLDGKCNLVLHLPRQRIPLCTQHLLTKAGGAELNQADIGASSYER